MGSRQRSGSLPRLSCILPSVRETTLENFKGDRALVKCLTGTESVAPSLATGPSPLGNKAKFPGSEVKKSALPALSPAVVPRQALERFGADQELGEQVPLAPPTPTPSLCHNYCLAHAQLRGRALRSSGMPMITSRV